MTIAGPLVDSFGRVHTNLRISVTDRCNIRCFYCMPHEDVQFKPRHELLSFEEIERFARVAARLGVRKLRLTGGEPLVRAELPALVAKLAAVPGIDDLAMTTNGILLAQHAAALKQAGLQRLNISLDAMREETFERIARRRGLDQVLAGIAEAQRQGFRRIRLNTVAIRGITEDEMVPLAGFARAARPRIAVHRVHAAGRRTALAKRTGVDRRRDPREIGSRIRTAHAGRPSRSQPTGGRLSVCRWRRGRVHQSGVGAVLW